MINKIIYFDKETISNMLEELNRGNRVVKTDVKSSSTFNAELSAEIDGAVDLKVPFLARLRFLFSGKLSSAYLVARDKLTSISSTEISEFDTLKSELFSLDNVQLQDIENSSTSIRLAGGYLQILKGGVEGIDTRGFNEVMDSFDGYDTYKYDDSTYLRFNNTAFLSNYKRNDLLMTTMSIYGIKVGEFSIDKFDFISEIKKMENLLGNGESNKKLAEVYPSALPLNNNECTEDKEWKNNPGKRVNLYDVVYASICMEKVDGQ